MKAVLSQVGGWEWEMPGRQLEGSRHSAMRTKAAHSWEGEKETANDCPKNIGRQVLMTMLIYK